MNAVLSINAHLCQKSDFSSKIRNLANSNFLNYFGFRTKMKEILKSRKKYLNFQDFRLKVTQIILNKTPIFDPFIRENPNILDFLPLKSSQ